LEKIVRVKATKFLFFTGMAFALLTGLGALANGQKTGKQLTIYATVLNKKDEALPDIKAENFRLFEEGREKKIVSITREDESLSVGFLLDTSGSMSGVWRKNIKGKPILLQGLADLIDNSNKDNEYFIVTFGNELHVLLDSTKDHFELGRALSNVAKVDAQGHTKLYDAVYSALKKISLTGHRKKALIIVSDAEDNNSLYSYTDLRRAISDSNTLIYFMQLSHGKDSGLAFGIAGRLFAEELAKVSGGRAYQIVSQSPQGDEFEASKAFSLLTKEMQNQYALTFEIGAAGLKNNWHELALKLIVPKEQENSLGKLAVRTRSGYFSFSDEILSEK
jgi:VWFA-related protein